MLRSSLEGQKWTPEQLLEQTLFEHVLHRKSYFTSVRPPSNTGRDQVTMATLSVTTVTLMSLGSEGGAGNDNNAMKWSKNFSILKACS